MLDLMQSVLTAGTNPTSHETAHFKRVGRYRSNSGGGTGVLAVLHEVEMELTHLSLFSGIGGIDLAAEWAGFKTVGQCEFADYPTKVLEKHWPDVPRWEDVRDVTIESIRRKGIGEITMLSGGFPCQPHSTAGKRLASLDERDLWGEFARVICEVEPRWILGENVAGLLTSEDGQFFGGILRDLVKMGYSVGWGSIRASWIGAVHRRERVFIVAHSNGKRFSRRPKEPLMAGSDEQLQRFLQTDFKPTLSKLRAYGNDHGIPARVDRLKCLGNAVVPQQVYPILQTIAEIERNQP